MGNKGAGMLLCGFISCLFLKNKEDLIQRCVGFPPARQLPTVSELSLEQIASDTRTQRSLHTLTITAKVQSQLNLTAQNVYLIY